MQVYVLVLWTRSYVKGRCSNLNMFEKLRDCCTEKTRKLKLEAPRKCEQVEEDQNKWCQGVPDEEQAQLLKGAVHPTGAFGYYEHQPADPCAMRLWANLSFVSLLVSNSCNF